MIHGIAENKEENTDQQAIDFTNDNLDTKIDDIDIDRYHSIKRFNKAKKKARPIIITFARCNVRGKLFREKKLQEKVLLKPLQRKGLAS